MNIYIFILKILIIRLTHEVQYQMQGEKKT